MGRMIHFDYLCISTYVNMLSGFFCSIRPTNRDSVFELLFFVFVVVVVLLIWGTYHIICWYSCHSTGWSKCWSWSSCPGKCKLHWNGIWYLLLPDLSTWGGFSGVPKPQQGCWCEMHSCTWFLYQWPSPTCRWAIIQWRPAWTVLGQPMALCMWCWLYFRNCLWCLQLQTIANWRWVQ